MIRITQTIPELLIETRGSISELARRINGNRATVRKYINDKKGARHIVVNGVLMVSQGGRGR